MLLITPLDDNLLHDIRGKGSSLQTDREASCFSDKNARRKKIIRGS